MENQKFINLLDNASNQLSKSKRKNWFEINNDTRRAYNPNNQMTLKSRRLKSGLHDYSDVYILVKGTIGITVAGEYSEATLGDEKNKQVIFQARQISNT